MEDSVLIDRGSVRTYLRTQRLQAGHTTIKSLANAMGCDASQYQMLCLYERARIPRTSDALNGLYARYLEALKVPTDKHDQIRIAAAKGETPSPLPSSLEQRVQPTRFIPRGRPYNEMHGRPATLLIAELNKHRDKNLFGGLFIGPTHEGRDWIAERMVIQNGPGEFSLDEVGYFVDMFVGIYEGQIEALSQMRKYFEDGSVKNGWPMMSPLGCLRLDDALGDMPETHILSAIEPTINAVRVKLDMFGIQGYVTAGIMKKHLDGARTKYDTARKETFDIAHKVAQEVSAARSKK